MGIIGELPKMSNNNLEKIDELERGLVEAERESYESKNWFTARVYKV